MDPTLLAADPVTVGAMVGALALIRFAAAWHKVSERDVFVGALQAYRLLPPGAAPALARVLPGIEIGLGIGILLPAGRQAALLAAAALLAVYAAAMTINLLRGRREIDCGCGGEGHPLSWGLVGRNLVLIGIALLISGPTRERDLEWLDMVTLLGGVLAFYALYLLIDELLRQFARIAQVRGQANQAGH